MAPRFEEDGGNVVLDPKTKPKVERPRLYKVLVHNDHYTTREFVVDVLMHVFNHSENEAIRIMTHVHQNGVGVAGVYAFDIAETKIQKVESLAREYEFPLRLTMEPEN